MTPPPEALAATLPKIAGTSNIIMETSLQSETSMAVHRL